MTVVSILKIVAALLFVLSGGAWVWVWFVNANKEDGNLMDHYDTRFFQVSSNSRIDDQSSPVQYRFLRFELCYCLSRVPDIC